MICIISKDATYGNCAGLAKAISATNNVELILSHTDKKDMYKQFPAKFGYKNIPDSADQTIIVGAISFNEAYTNAPARIDRLLKNSKAKIILTDSFYLNRYEKLNDLYDKMGLIVYCMPQLLYCRGDRKTLPYYQPFDLFSYPVVKNEKLTICHTPFHSSKIDLKGTKYINSFVNDFDVRYDLVMNKTWQETLKIRSASHISIDAIVKIGEWTNGVGKSGLEAMWLGSAVITTGHQVYTEQIPPPPILYTTIEDFKNDLRTLIFNDDFRNDQVLEQRRWAEKYTSYEFVSKH